jgi:glucan 1,4-alpha-glucosidase
MYRLTGTIPRKAKGTDKWFVGAITDENRREIDIDLSFLDKEKRYLATIYGDAQSADWVTNPEAYEIRKVPVDNHSHLLLKLAAGGGSAVSIAPQ